MNRLIEGARYRRDNWKYHAHQDPEMAKAMLIDAGFRHMSLVSIGDELAAVVQKYEPQSCALKKWRDATK